ncbi:MAG: PIG-L family deacetylase [Acidobacteriaceae bacterium]|nr:PIG-L family deacetylase [Acidobacteriaceae bacterium]
MKTSLSRRALVLGAGLSYAAAGSSQAAPAPSGKWKVLVTGGHPGDPEYGCGGTIARFTDLGHEVTILYLNRGEKGCAGKSDDACAQVRTAEAQEACRMLKARPRFAALIDGEAVVSPATYSSFSQLVKSEAPTVILTHWPIDNHRDHRAASMLTYDAWRQIKDRCSLYYYEVSDGEDTMMFSPTDYVDITATESRKRTACYAHASQSPDRFYALQSEVTQFRGTQAGFRHAEAFIRHVESPAHVLPA